MCTCSWTVGKKKVPFTIAKENVELVQECLPKHLSMGTARMKQDKATEDSMRREARLWTEAKRTQKKIKKFRRLITTKAKYNSNKHMVVF